MRGSYVAEPLRRDSSAPHWDRDITAGSPAAACAAPGAVATSRVSASDRPGSTRSARSPTGRRPVRLSIRTWMPSDGPANSGEVPARAGRPTPSAPSTGTAPSPSAGPSPESVARVAHGCQVPSLRVRTVTTRSSAATGVGWTASHVTPTRLKSEVSVRAGEDLGDVVRVVRRLRLSWLPDAPAPRPTPLRPPRPRQQSTAAERRGAGQRRRARRSARRGERAQRR